MASVLTNTSAAVFPEPPSPGRLRQLFRTHPAGVVVVTADAGRGPVGFTATSFTSVSLHPPLVSFAVATQGSSWPHLRDAETAVVNLLGDDQESLARRFATSGVDRFAAPTRWRRLADGEPVLEDSRGWLRVRVVDLVAAGDHRVVLARLEESSLRDGHRPLVYHDGRYRSL